MLLLQVVDAADVVLEVLDARDPLGSRCAEMESTVLNSGTNKRLVLVLNKIGNSGTNKRLVLVLNKIGTVQNEEFT